MDTVYDVWFVREYEHREDTQLHIGIYASETDAAVVIETLKDKPGFRDFPEGFQVNQTKLGLTGWQDGFVTDFGPPCTDA